MPKFIKRRVSSGSRTYRKGIRKVATVSKYTYLPTGKKTVVRGGAQRGTHVTVIPRYPFMKDLYCTLKYNDTFTLSSTTGSVATQTFRLNSLFDCDFTGTGHQPRFFDTLCGADVGSAPYGKYRVLGAKINVVFMNSNSSVTSVGYVGIHTRTDDSTVISSGTFLPEIPHTIYKMTNVSTGISNFHRLSMKASMKKLLGKKDLKDSDSTSAEYNANPTDVVYADVFYYPRDGATTASIQIDVFIQFFCQFFDQNLPNSS